MKDLWERFKTWIGDIPWLAVLVSASLLTLILSVLYKAAPSWTWIVAYAINIVFVVVGWKAGKRK